MLSLRSRNHRWKKEVLEDLLNELAQAKPSISRNKAKRAVAGESEIAKEGRLHPLIAVELGEGTPSRHADVPPEAHACGRE